MDLDKIKALALAYTYENGDHWYCLPQIADGITYEPASEFITGASPATVLQLIELARRAALTHPSVDASQLAVVDEKAPPVTYMTQDQALNWAWKELKKDLNAERWAVGYLPLSAVVQLSLPPDAGGGMFESGVNSHIYRKPGDTLVAIYAKDRIE